MHSIRSLGEHRRHVSPLMWVRCPEVHCPEGLGAAHLLTAPGKRELGWACPAAPRTVAATCYLEPSSFGPGKLVYELCFETVIHPE